MAPKWGTKWLLLLLTMATSSLFNYRTLRALFEQNCPSVNHRYCPPKAPIKKKEIDNTLTLYRVYKR